MGFLTNFAFKTLALLGFDKHHTAIAPCHTLLLTICSETEPVQPDLCVVYTHEQFILLVFVDDETNAKARAIAGAIAAFHINNNKSKDCRLDPWIL